MGDIIPFQIGRQDDGELRISDIEMAERLEYPSIRDFRRLISRHSSTLRQFGQLCTVPTRNEKGGHAVNSYSLSEQRAIYVVAKSEVPLAVEITVAIVKAFVAYRRSTINQKLYGAVGMELLGFTPRTWGREYSESFFLNLHRVAGWTRPEGNNHSNCAHFINRYIYEFLFGELGLVALQEANPADEGRRAHKHHQMIKDKHMPRLKQHIEIIAALLANAISLDMFDDSFNRVFPKLNTQVGFLFGERIG